MNEAKNAKFRENHECCSSILSFLMNFLKNIAFFFKFLIFCEIFVCFIFFGEMFTLFFRKIYAFIREIFAFLILWKFRFYHETDWSEILQKAKICASERNAKIFLFCWKSYFGLELNQQLLKLSLYCTLYLNYESKEVSTIYKKIRI